MDVLGVDGDPQQTSGAIKIDQMFDKRMKNVQQVPPGQLQHITLQITADTVDQLQQEVINFTSHYDNWLLCGLHTCGPLAYTTLNLFQRSKAKCLISVACCYHKLEGTNYFPASTFLKNHTETNEHVKLKRLAYKISCQTPVTWVAHPDRCVEFFKRHFFRALLQKLMVDNGWLTEFETLPPVGKLPKDSYTTFSIYASRVLTFFQKPLLDPIVLETFHNQYFYGYVQIALVWTLQSSLAPSIESLLIMDRYLAVQDIVTPNHVQLVPLFDIHISPRCFAIMAHK